MVTTRNTGSKFSTMRTSFENYLNDFGTTVILRKTTETKDSMNRITGTVTETSTIKADIQWVTKKEIEYLNLGEAQIGDGMLFVKYNADIDIEDEVEINSERYRVTAMVEGELVEGQKTYQGFLIRRNAQS